MLTYTDFSYYKGNIVDVEVQTSDAEEAIIMPNSNNSFLNVNDNKAEEAARDEVIEDPVVETSVKVNEVLCGDNEFNLLKELQMTFLPKKLEKIM